MITGIPFSSARVLACRCEMSGASLLLCCGCFCGVELSNSDCRLAALLVRQHADLGKLLARVIQSFKLGINDLSVKAMSLRTHFEKNVFPVDLGHWVEAHMRHNPSEQ